MLVKNNETISVHLFLLGSKVWRFGSKKDKILTSLANSEHHFTKLPLGLSREILREKASIAL